MFLLLLLLLSFSAKGELLLLTLGERISLPLPQEKVLYIENKSLLSIKEQNSSLILRAKKQGSTFLNLGQKTYHLAIVAQSEKQKIKTLNQFLKPLWGLSWSLIQNKIFITGKLHRLTDWFRLAQLSQTHQMNYEFKAQLGEELSPSLNQLFKQKFKNRTPPRIEPRHFPVVFIPKEESEEFYKKELKSFGLIPKKDSEWFAPPPFIKIDIALIEMSQTFSSSLGGTLLSPTENLSFASFLDFLNFLKSKGKGKVIHQTSLLTQDKQKINFHSGGHLPFMQSNLQTQQQSVQWKSYGLNLMITPFLDSFNNLKLEMEWRLSEPTSSLPSRNLPPLKNHKWKTTFQMKTGQILKLFYQNKKGKGHTSAGGLFSLIPKNLKTKSNEYQKSQFLFIQPSLLKNSDHQKTPSELKSLKK